MIYKLVSCVITNWNRANDLWNLLCDIAESTYPNIEVIVVDNHSTDASIEMMQTQFPEIKLIVYPHNQFGACQAFNEGVRAANGEFVFLMDNDILLQKDSIEKMVTRLAELPDDVAILTSLVVTPTGLQAPKYPKKYEHDVMYFHGACSCGRRDILKNIGYNEKFYFYWNEIELAHHLTYHGYRLVYSPVTIIFHKINKAGRESLRNMYFFYRNGFWLLWLHYPFWMMAINTLKSVWELFLNAISYSRRYRTLRIYPVLLRGYKDALFGLPYCLQNREPVERMNDKEWYRKVSE